jgi:membrane fusion protein (multidrug efflux system)
VIERVQVANYRPLADRALLGGVSRVDLKSNDDGASRCRRCCAAWSRRSWLSVTVDKSTDTVEVRAVFPNAKGSLIDNQLVNVNLEAANPQEQVVIPQSALISDQQGIYVFIAEDGKAAIRRIKTGGATGEDIVVTEGLKGGELVIVEGTQTLRPGTPVQSKPVTSALNRS